MNVTVVITILIVNFILYSLGMRRGIRYYKSVIKNKHAVGMLVMEELANEPINLYLAIESYDKLIDCGSEVILQVVRK